MAPKRGYCYKCDKFQTHIRRHVKSCNADTPIRKRRVTTGNSYGSCVTGGNTQLSMENPYQQNSSSSNTNWNNLPKETFANTIQTILTERIDGFRQIHEQQYKQAPATILDMLIHKSVKKANTEALKHNMMNDQFPRLKVSE